MRDDDFDYESDTYEEPDFGDLVDRAWEYEKDRRLEEDWKEAHNGI